MTTSTYTAWNGKDYAWPPPVGWHEASDGRWWAPGTGPELYLTPPVEAGSEPPRRSRIEAPVVSLAPITMPSLNSPAALAITTTKWPPPSHRNGGSILPAPRPREVLARAIQAAPAQPALAQPAPARPAPVHQAPTQRALAPEIPVWNPDPVQPALAEPVRHQLPLVSVPPPALRRRRAVLDWLSQPSSIVVVGLAAATIIAVVIGGRAMLERDTQTVDAQQIDGDVTASTVASSSSEVLVPTGPSRSSDGHEQPVVVASEAARTGTDQDGESDTGDFNTSQSNTTEVGDGWGTTTNDDEIGTIDLAELGPVITQYRNLLTARSITTEALTDADVVQFAHTACTYATTAADQADYEQIRDEAVEGIENDQLTQAELRFALDAAVAIFCPSEADRISLRP